MPSLSRAQSSIAFLKTALLIAVACLSAPGALANPAHFQCLPAPTIAAPASLIAPLTAIEDLCLQGSEQAPEHPLENPSSGRLSGAAIDNIDSSEIRQQEFYVDWSAWMSEVAQRWETAADLRQMRQENVTSGTGAAFIEFTCRRDGSVDHVSILQSSGESRFDQQHLEALSQCVPLPPFPPGSRRQSVTLLYVWAERPASCASEKRQPRAVGSESPLETVSRPKGTL